jgi:hypothetical protein
MISSSPASGRATQCNAFWTRPRRRIDSAKLAALRTVMIGTCRRLLDTVDCERIVGVHDSTQHRYSGFSGCPILMTSGTVFSPTCSSFGSPAARALVAKYAITAGVSLPPRRTMAVYVRCASSRSFLLALRAFRAKSSVAISLLQFDRLRHERYTERLQDQADGVKYARVVSTGEVQTYSSLRLLIEYE